MFSRVRSYIIKQVYSGRITPWDALTISSSLNSVGSDANRGAGPGGARSGIFDLPEDLRTVTTDAFKDALRWAFLSLVPWLAIAFVMSLFLNKIDEERMGGIGTKPHPATPERRNSSEQETKREEQTVV
jgi:hypothetical protein